MALFVGNNIFFLCKLKIWSLSVAGARTLTNKHLKQKKMYIWKQNTAKKEKTNYLERIV